MQNSIFSTIRRQKSAVQLFVAVMTNWMVFAAPLSYARNHDQWHVNTAGMNTGAALEKPEEIAVPNKRVQSPIPQHARQQTIISEAITPEADGAIITSLEKQGIIGKSDNLPIDELTDNIFTFELKSDVKEDKDIYLEYELFGLADGSQAIKSINDEPATGGLIITATKKWTKVREKLNPANFSKGRNHISFTTWEQSKYQYMVRNMKLVFENRTTLSPITFNQSEAQSFNGTLAVGGFMADPKVSEVSILGKKYPVINGVFEALVEEKAPNHQLQVIWNDANGSEQSGTINVVELLDKPSEVHKEPKTSNSISRLFYKGTKNTMEFGGARLEVDTLSTDADRSVSITGLRYIDLPTLSPEMVNVTATYAGYRMLPHGNLFVKPAKVYIKYDQSKLPSGYTAKDIRTFYFDIDQKKWLALEKDTLLSTTGEIVSRTTHFTDFINGIIKVPESPETGSYTPTSIKDIKAADPTAGVVSIPPPTPNNMGTVNTSFPIKLPAGRAGMQPSLSVNYNSEGGNGWMGLGWDLSVPAISLDTRWGAPRYGDLNGDFIFDNIETEIYTLGGQMLTYKIGEDVDGMPSNYTNPNRHDNIPSVAERQLYPRIEGSYSKIIRHGDNPTNYYWEVTDKMGNKSFYGGVTAVDDNAVVRTHDDGITTVQVNDETTYTEANNITYWALCQTQDINGNFVRYIYDKHTTDLTGPGQGGIEFYPKEIQYTLHNTITQDSYYKVEFIKDGDSYSDQGVLYPFSNRQDKQLYARNGVVQVTKNLLREIKIGLFDSNINDVKPIRSYHFDYITNFAEKRFFKEKLEKISEFDASGDLFYSNTMEYYKTADDGTVVSNDNIFGEVDNSWDGATNNIDGDLITGNAIGQILSNFTNHASALGASESGGVYGGLYLGFALSCVGGTNSFTAGINIGFDYATGGGLISFTDINGDGLPDKVFRKDDILHFRPNLGNAFGGDVPITGITNFSRNRSNSFSIGGSASYGAFLGYTYNKSKSVNSVYFSDVNGDGLTDVVSDGRVFFNQADTDHFMDTVDFSDANGETLNPVSAGEITQGIIDNIDLETMEQLEDENPQHDIVKMWTAPMAGDINISGPATLTPLPPTTQNPYPTNSITDYDGVVVSIQQNDGTNSVILHHDLSPTFSSVGIPSLAAYNMDTTTHVDIGDRIYFRVQAKTEASYDRVEWNPKIEYTSGTNIAALDANGLSYFSSYASDGFILSAKTLVVVNQGGVVGYVWNPSLSTIPSITTDNINAYSDNLTFKIEQGTIDPTSEMFVPSDTFTATYNQMVGGSISPADFVSIANSAVHLPNSVADHTAFQFSVISNSNVNWKQIDWSPTIQAGGQTLFPVVNYEIYNTKINSDQISRFTINPLQPVTIKPVLDPAVIGASSMTDLPNGSYGISVVVKNSNKKVLATLPVIVNRNGSTVTFSGAGINGTTITADLTSDIFVELYSSTFGLSNLGNLVSEPIKAVISQPVAPVTTLPVYTIPTGACSTNNSLTAVDFDSLHDSGINCASNYYENRSAIVANPYLIKGSTYSLDVTLDNAAATGGHAAVWLDFDRNGAVTSGELFTSTTLNYNHTFTIPIPAGVSDGKVLMRVIGGSATPYSSGSVYTAAGTVRDYTLELMQNSQYSKDIYCNTGNDAFGPNYRRWGQFAYHGGIVVERTSVDTDGENGIDPWEVNNTVVLDSSGNPNVIARYGFFLNGDIVPIQQSVLVSANAAVQSCINSSNDGQTIANCIQQNNTQTTSNTRFIGLSPDGENLLWQSTDGINVSEGFFSTSRFGVKNLNTIFIEMVAQPPTAAQDCVYPLVNGVTLINKGEGHSVAAGTGGGFSASGNFSTSFNWSELSYLDINGDRYPDVLTRDNAQLTSALGGLAEQRPLGFGRVITSTAESWGATASGTFVTAKTCDPKYDIAWSVGGVKPTIKSPDQPQAKSSIGVTVGGGGGKNTEALLWLDMNGDGLLDRVNAKDGLNVSLNLGYSFDTERSWSSTHLGGKQSNVSGGAGFTYGFNAFSAGLTASASSAYTESNLMDINGDGLLDLLTDSSDGSFHYALNTGTGFIGSYAIEGHINRNMSTAEGANGSFTIPICILGLFQINVTPKFGGEQSLSRDEITIQDINGDGFADILTAGDGNNRASGSGDTDDGELHARLSKIGKTNLLRKVNTPTGGSWEVTYSREGSTFELPQNKYVLDAIAVYDGFTTDNTFSPDRAVTTIKYKDPHYDRREREFFGFEKVTIEQREGYNDNLHITDVVVPAAPINYPPIYRYTEQLFHNNNYYLKGALKEATLFDASGVPWTESITAYGVYRRGTALSGAETVPSIGTYTATTFTLTPPISPNPFKKGTSVISTAAINGDPNASNGYICTDYDHASLFVTPLATIKHFTEGGSGHKYAVTRLEAFDEYGNVTQFRDYGEQNTDVYVSTITYYAGSAFSSLDNAVAYPEYVRVYESDGSTLKRERKAIYYPATVSTGNAGLLHQVITKLNGAENATVSMEYDSYGNLSKITNEDSVNPDVSGSHYFKQYTYDSVLHMFPTIVEDAFGYSSTSEYNLLFGVPVFTVDMNLQPSRTRIDDRGRVVEITGPYELFVEEVANEDLPAWTIRFEYEGETDDVATRVADYEINQYGPIASELFNGTLDGKGAFQALNSGETGSALHHALTRHFDPEYRAGVQSVVTANQVLTSTLVDGLGKAVQVKKSGAVFTGPVATPSPLQAVNTDANNIMYWLLNGKVENDPIGRAIKSYYPTTQTGNFSGLTTNVSDVPSNAFVYDPATATAPPAKAAYDVLDRMVSTTSPGETAQSTFEYSIDSGTNQFLTTVTNELGQVQKSFTDVRGKTRQTLQESVTGSIPTLFDYNNIGELTMVTDVAQNKTFSEYDLAGRRTAVRHPDSGVTLFKYDLASNLVERRTSNLLHTGATEHIQYNYTFNRLKEVIYPEFPENNTHYYYGESGSSGSANDNAVGRLWYESDATGAQNFKYGRLGEVTKNLRSIVVPGDRIYWFQTEWTYDTWNRVKTIKYPDEETVTYHYNRGGELHAMTTDKPGQTGQKNIISQLGYDEFGQRKYLRYGNGTETTYSYEADRRRLHQMEVMSKTNLGAAVNRTFISNSYDYDILSNVKGIYNNTVELPESGQIGGRSWQEFTYDDLNQLTTATGNFVGANTGTGTGQSFSKYTLAMSYDSQHNIKLKTQVHESATSVGDTGVAGDYTQVEQSTYALDYKDYNSAGYTVDSFPYSQPHAPRKIVDQPVTPGCCNGETDPRVKTKLYDYDFNGNQIKVSEKICTAENPDVVRENLWDEENRLRAIDLNPEASGVHPISIYTYDAGGERIIKQNSSSVAVYENGENVGSAIQSDFMLYPSGMLVARPAADGTGALTYTKHYFAGSQRVSSKIGTTTNLGRLLDEWTQVENSSDAPVSIVEASQDQLTQAEAGVTHVYTAFEITPAPMFASNPSTESVQAFIHGANETEQFWFHPDHLGSSNYITNFVGGVSQHMEYFAFGETFVEEHQNSINSPYKFNGKELDEESGLYYYGARYYDARISMWASVDPLAEKFAGRSPYEYVFSNPINLVDPTGMGPDKNNPGEPPKKNIYVIISKPDEKFNFDDFEKNGWHGIVADNIDIANNMVKEYLNGATADNIVYEAHGGVIDYSDGTKSSGTRYNNSTSKITGSELCNYAAGKKTNIDAKSIESLISLAKQAKTFTMLVCNVNYDQSHSFGLNLSDLAPKTSIFITADQVIIPNSNHNKSNSTIGRSLFDCSTYKCGILNNPLGFEMYYGWTNYKTGAIIDMFKDLKLSAISGNPIPIRK